MTRRSNSNLSPYFFQDEVFSEGTTELTSGVRSGDRGQEVVDERGQLLESPSPNVVSVNRKQFCHNMNNNDENMSF